MTVIKQRTKCDCMVASLAMLLGCSYETMSKMFPQYAVSVTGYRWEWIIPYLHANGIFLNWVDTKNMVIDFSMPAVLDVPSLTMPDRGDHLIYWNGEKIIDPGNSNKIYTKIPEIIHCAYQINEQWRIRTQESINKITNATI